MVGGGKGPHKGPLTHQTTNRAGGLAESHEAMACWVTLGSKSPRDRLGSRSVGGGGQGAWAGGRGPTHPCIPPPATPRAPSAAARRRKTTIHGQTFHKFRPFPSQTTHRLPPSFECIFLMPQCSPSSGRALRFRRHFRQLFHLVLASAFPSNCAVPTTIPKNSFALPLCPFHLSTNCRLLLPLCTAMLSPSTWSQCPEFITHTPIQMAGMGRRS